VHFASRVSRTTAVAAALSCASTNKNFL